MSASAPNKHLVIVVCYNEIKTIEDVLNRLSRTLAELRQQRPDAQFDAIVVDDCSNDGSEKLIQELSARYQFTAARNDRNSGVGFSLLRGFRHAKEHGHDSVTIIAGNGKMSPEQIPTVLAPLLENRADFVQGSRYLAGGDYRMPMSRIAGTVLFTNLVNLFMRAGLSDTTCGFRAYRMKIVSDPRLNVEQEWLYKYEMEFYLLFYALKLRYRVIEAPVSMRYPHKKKYSKIKPLTGWWSMIRPWVLLYSGVRK